MFQNKKIGIIILIAHFLGAIINGLLYRKYKLEKVHISSNIDYSLPENKNMLEDIMISSIKSILIVGGYVAIFFVIITMLNNYNILFPIKYLFNIIFNLLNINTSISTPIISGIIEVTKGCLELSKLQNISFSLKTIVATFLIGFGGFSIHLQALTFIKKFNIKISFYLFQKLTHATISAIISFLICLIF